MKNTLKQQFRSSVPLPKEDLLATACAFTGEAVARSMKENVPEDIIKSTDKLYASGGGVKNPQIMKEIRNVFRIILK